MLELSSSKFGEHGYTVGQALLTFFLIFCDDTDGECMKSSTTPSFFPDGVMLIYPPDLKVKFKGGKAK